MLEYRKCRLCMGYKSNQIPIFKRDVSMKIMKLADVQIREDDGLPTTICIDCETELGHCYDFIGKIQWADKKFREDMKTTEIEVNECNIKEELGIYEGLKSESSFIDNSFYEMADVQKTFYTTGVNEKTETECLNNPINHIEIEDNIRGCSDQMEVSSDPLGQEEPLIDAQMTFDSEPAMDPLTCMKEEAVQMDNTDNKAENTTSSSMTCMKEEAVQMDNTVNKAENTTSSSTVRLPVPKISSPVFPMDQINVNGVIGTKTNCQLNPGLYQIITLQTSSSFDKGSSIIPSKQNLNNDFKNSFAIADSNSPNIYNLIGVVNNEIVPYNSNQLGTKIVTKATTDQVYRPTTCIPLSKGNNVLAYKKPNIKNNSKSKLCSTSFAVASSDEAREMNCISSDKTQTLPSNSDKSEATEYYNCNSQIKSDNYEKFKDQNKGKNESFCAVCYLDFGSLELLQEHKERNIYFCRVCINEFESHSQLEAHFITHTVFKCKVCGEVFFYKGDLFKHQKEVSSCNNRVECEICQKRFAKRHLKKHKLYVHCDTKISHTCNVCKKTFKRANILQDHLKSTHTAYEYLECRTCKKLFMSPDKLKVHVQTTHINDDDSFRPTFVCPVCKKVFKRNDSMIKHLENHSGTTSLCEVCGKSIKGKEAMKYHLDRVHSKSGPFTCKTCNQKFDLKIAYYKHKRVHHRNLIPPEPVYCEICGKKYKTSAVLQIHKLIHSDEKPFKCDVCGASFKQQVALRTHRRVHSSVGKYCCNDCGTTFRWKQTFDKHVKRCAVGDSEDSSNI